jgi:hypothetical protein
MSPMLYITGVAKIIAASNYQAIKSYRRYRIKIPFVYLGYM